ncbi:ribonuclease [Nocardioides oleivorans]|uniref:Ribonuclease n=1 Tax=Nocardioides oleivorans TaxID=273676 RepID=A0A4Q2S5B1_9ACTN|nr:ribonuclease domain-containing protein [Nocardioides oleivorans]RYB95549.1 ribonuclease [Nocardioides oleivorans]
MAASAGRQRYRWLVLLASAVLLVIWFLTPAGQDDPGASGGGPTSSPTVPSAVSTDDTTTFPETSPPETTGSVDPDSGLPVVRVDDLPAQVAETIALIEDGGPFPEDRDGITFENREGILPDASRGYYREYTVPTPGSDDRGARRIVEGGDGELYWTADHYASFARIAGYP